jgi:hypothetical protein
MNVLPWHTLGSRDPVNFGAKNHWQKEAGERNFHERPCCDRRTFRLAFLGVAWITPLKLKLMKLHGADKPPKFFMALARQGDALAKTVVFRTKVFMGVGIGGVFLLALSKAFAS